MDTFKEKLITKALAENDQTLAPYIAKVDKYDADFIRTRLSPFSNIIKSSILENAFNHESSVERNRYILRTSAELTELLPKKIAQMFFAYDSDIQLKAKECADYCRRISINPDPIRYFFAINSENTIDANLRLDSNDCVNGNFVPNYTEQERNDSLIAVKGFRYGDTEKHTEFGVGVQQFIYDRLCEFAHSFGLIPPKPTEKSQSLTGSIKRLVDNRWWLRKFRKLINQANEKAAIKFNLVNSKRQIYASTITTKNRIAQRLRNEELLSSHFIINDAGQRYSLQEISDLNVSNPKVRKDELICRARGFEDLAKSLGHEALFITVTCPSKYHRAFAKSGAENPKWQGLMPDKANEYLNHQWQKTRAELKRQDINPYGFRVVEPQHDGTPHWHMLFFVEADKLKALQTIVRHYALEVDGDEKGAAENRCDFKEIDPSKGSATGYILKYIVKNIDGEGLGEDLFGNDAILVAQRIDAWASCWCIRQFQQIGGASVSVWRELRRLKNKLFSKNDDYDNNDSVIEQARQAADNSDWQSYTIVMGGIYVKAKGRPIKLHYECDINQNTGEYSQSYYDGEMLVRPKGLWFAGQIFITRLFTWRLEKNSS